MAEASKSVQETVTRTTTITLTLSEAEAVTLGAILGCVGGSRTESYRKEAAAVLAALDIAGVCWFGSGAQKSLSGTLRFGQF